MSKIDDFYFTDFKYFDEKTFTGTKQFHRYVKKNMVKIITGGNCLYITSDKWKNTNHFTESAYCSCSSEDMAYVLNY